MKGLKIFFILFSVAFFLPAKAQAGVAVGESAPDFKLNDTRNNPVSLSAYQGKFVVLEWFNPDCPFVRKHYDSGNMQRLQKNYTEKGVVWLSICSSAPGKQGSYSAEQTNEIMTQRGAQSTAILLDTTGEVGHLYDAKTTPHIFIIGPDGKVIYQGAVDSIASTDQTDIPQAENYVESALDAAMAGQPVTVASSTKSYGCSVKY